MPINVFGNSSHDNNNKNDTSLFVQKPYSRTNYIEANIEEDIDLKNKYRIKNLHDPISIREACSKNYNDNSVDESSLLRLDSNETLDLNNQDSILLNSTKILPVTIIEIPTKAYIDSLHEENVKINRDNDFNKYRISNIESARVNRNHSLDDEVSNKKYVDDQIDKNTLVRFNQTLSNYLKVSVGNNTYNLTKYNKIQLTDITTIKYPNTGGYLLPG